MKNYKQDYCSWCGEDCVELSTLSTCSRQCDFERAQQLVEKWKDVIDNTRLVSAEEREEPLKNEVILESEERWIINTREQEIAEIKKRHAEFLRKKE